MRRPHSSTRSCSRSFVAPTLYMVSRNDRADDPFSSSSSSEEELNWVSGGRGSNYTAIVDKKMRVAKAQAEIDRILNCPVDPPFDVESELQKVISVSPQLVKEGTPEYDLEQEISKWEEDLYRAVKQQDYTRAHRQQAKISQRHVDDCGDVLQVNSAFYSAFSKKDLKAMEQLWLQENTAICIHPSHNPLLGYSDVMKGWKSMFESSNGSFQKNWMEPTQIRLSVRGATAIVTCEELVYVRRFVRGQRRQDELINKLLATNIFRKVDGKWYMNYHHTSWHADSEAAKYALKCSTQAAKAPLGGNSSGRKVGGLESIAAGSGSRPKIVIRRPPRGNNEDGSVSGLDGILGMNNFGPLLGDGKGSPDGAEGANGNGPVKRVIMGSLSDLLNGGLGDILDGKGGNVGGKDGNDEQSGTVIFSSSIEEYDDDGDDDDIHDHILGDDEDDYDEDEEEVDMMLLSKSLPEPTRKIVSIEKLPSSSPSPSSPQKKQSQPSSKESLRQACIATLRKLATRGSISAKQKRVLLTDIINCSAKGETSKVEHAYELLCWDDEFGDDDDSDVEEEFADQCRIFATSFPDFSPPHHSG